MAGWATLARDRADQLAEELDELKSQDVAQKTITALGKRLDEVRQTYINKKHSVAWLTGGAIYASWSELHRIGEGILRVTKDDAAVEAVAQRAIDQDLPDQRAAELRKRLGAATLGPERRSVAVEAINEAHRTAEAMHESERNQQRGILGIGAGLFLAAIVTVVVQAAVPGGDRLIPLPSNGATMPSWALLAVVMLFGVLGGSMSALFSLYITDQVITNTLWFDPRPGLSLVKAVIGLWTAIVGILAVGTGVVVGIYTSLPAVLLLAFLFGYGQQAVTRFIDRKVVALVAAPKQP